MRVKLHLKDLIDAFKTRVANGFDNPIAITGNRGIGKSDLAVNLARRLPPFKMSVQITYTREQLMKVMNDYKNLVIIADESITVAHNRNFFEKEQKDLVAMLNMYRDNHHTIIFCIKDFWVLDNQLRNLLSMRIHIERRGFAILHVPHQSSFSSDKWDVLTNSKVEKNWLTKKIYRPNYNRFTTFKGLVTYTKLPKKIRERYDKIKENKRNKVFKEEIATQDKRITIMDVYETPTKERFEAMKKYAIENNVLISSVAREMREIERYALVHSDVPDSSGFDVKKKKVERVHLPIKRALPPIPT